MAVEYRLCVSWTDFDECENDPCKNGGECINGDNTYTCKCMPGYTGTNCETSMRKRVCYTNCTI